MSVPDVRYARSGDVAIAYQVLGEGPPDLVLVPFLANIYTLWQAPGFAALARRLATGRRLILINPRGIGLSDRPRGFTVESRMDDIRAVSDELESERPAVLGLAEGAASCAVFAASYPDRVERLILFNPWARTASSAEEHADAVAHIRQEQETWGRRDVLEPLASRINPQWADDRSYLDWFVWHQRLTASPAAWADFRRMQLDLDITSVLPAIRVPTLVISKQHLQEAADVVAAGIPGAQHVVVPGRGGAFHENEFAVEAVEVFLAGATQRQVPDTVLATVLFTDLVGSTERAVELGDRAWRELERHNDLVRRELERFRGVELDTAGDGFLARFDGPARAIACARSIAEGVPELGLTVRAGIHTGECERVGEKLAGLAVNVGARVCAAARPGEILVTGTVKDLVAGSDIAFADRGVQELKGAGEWRLYAVAPA